MKQPKCPWCGMGFRGDQSDSWHVEGFREEGRCGSQWFPDFEGGLAEGRKQSEACREIARLKIAHLRRMEESLLPKMIAIEQSWRTEMARRSKGLPYQLPSVSHRKYLRMGRLADAIEAKITELKESQCSTKS